MKTSVGLNSAPVGADASGHRWSVRIFWAALAVFIFVLPVQHTAAARYIAFVAMIGAASAFLLASRRLPVFPLALPWAAYAGVALLSLAYALDRGYSLREIRTEVLYCAAVFVVAASMSSMRHISRGVGLIVATANLAYVAAALAYVDPTEPMDALRRMPPIAFAGVNSNLLVTIIPLVAYVGVVLWQEGKRLAALAVAGLVCLDVTALVISYNRQALIALSACVLVAGLLILRRHFSWQRLTVLALLVALIAGLFALQIARRAGDASTMAAAVDTSFVRDARWDLWRTALDGTADRPWTGGGFGRNAFSLLYPSFKAGDPSLWHAHNMVLNKGVQMGLPGVAAFLLLWAALVREFVRQCRGPGFPLAVAGLATLAAVFMKNMTDDFFVRDMALLFWLLMGVYVGTLRTWARRETASA